MPSPSKRFTDIDSRGNIKIDYSSTYQENSTLSNNLEGKLANIHKQKFRKSIDTDDALREARKEVEEIDRLNSAIKRGEVKDSVSIYDRKSHSPKSREGTRMSHSTTGMTPLPDAEVRPQTTQEPAIGIEPDKPAMSTLTMFALSMQKFSTSRSPVKSDSSKVVQRNIQGYRSFLSLRCFSSPAYLRKDRSKRQRRPAIVRFQDLKDGEVMEAQDIPVMKPEVVYAMQLRKRQIRSRRELQEMSKIEQEERLGKPDRSEEFKQRKYAWAKGNLGLTRRIKTFIMDVESFNKQQKQPDYILSDANVVRPKTL